jgi:RimJ/RimL family protein N-acetyltransferase
VQIAHAHGRRVIATVARGNAASLRILAKLGLDVVSQLYSGETLLLRERAGTG